MDEVTDENSVGDWTFTVEWSPDTANERLVVNTHCGPAKVELSGSASNVPPRSPNRYRVYRPRKRRT